MDSVWTPVSPKAVVEVLTCQLSYSFSLPELHCSMKEVVGCSSQLKGEISNIPVVLGQAQGGQVGVGGLVNGVVTGAHPQACPSTSGLPTHPSRLPCLDGTIIMVLLK